MMAAKKATIYITPPLAKVLYDENVGLTEQLSLIADRYARACVEHCPPLTVQEWAMVFDTANGLYLGAGEGPDPAPVFWGELEDNERLNGAGKQFGCDGNALARKVRELPYMAQVALLEAAARFWADENISNMSVADSCKRLGIPVANP